MQARFQVFKATPEDAAELAAIHTAARREAMPYLPVLHTAQETIEWFRRRMAESPDAFWIVQASHLILGYYALIGVELEDLYVRPGHQGRGVGSALLQQAKALSPRRLELWTFERNTLARAFYEARGFRAVRRTHGENEERLPDFRYVWTER
jgi:GNAT superfamily N-acetyltransferase